MWLAKFGQNNVLARDANSRDWDETLVRLETVSRPRQHPWNRPTRTELNSIAPTFCGGRVNVNTQKSSVAGDRRLLGIYTDRFLRTIWYRNFDDVVGIHGYTRRLHGIGWRLTREYWVVSSTEYRPTLCPIDPPHGMQHGCDECCLRHDRLWVI